MNTEEIEKTIEDVSKSNLNDNNKMILLQILQKELLEIRSKEARIKDNIDFYHSK